MIVTGKSRMDARQNRDKSLKGAEPIAGAYSANPSNRHRAASRSAVSWPSSKPAKSGLSSLVACLPFPVSCQSRAKAVAARNSRERAP